MGHFHNILGVSERATVEEIKSAFRKKAKILHPDINKSPNSENVFRELKNAYEELLKITPKKKSYEDDLDKNAIMPEKKGGWKPPHDRVLFKVFNKLLSSEYITVTIPQTYADKGCFVLMAFKKSDQEWRVSIPPGAKRGFVTSLRHNDGYDIKLSLNVVSDKSYAESLTPNEFF